jgi:hypothetical protein
LRDQGSPPAFQNSTNSNVSFDYALIMVRRDTKCGRAVI